MGQATQEPVKSLSQRPLIDIVGSIVLLAAACASAALPIWLFTIDGFTWRAISLAIAQTPVISIFAWAGFKAGWGHIYAPSQEERALEQLTRPARWAGYAGVFSVFIALSMWRDGLLDMTMTTGTLIALLGGIAGLCFWADMRIAGYFWSKTPR